MSNREIAYINGKSLEWAINRIRITVPILSEKTEIPKDDIISWINEDSSPSFAKARKLCKFLRINIAMLYMEADDLGGRKIDIDARVIYDSAVLIGIDTRIKVIEYIEKAEHHRAISQKYFLASSVIRIDSNNRQEIIDYTRSALGISSPRGFYANKNKWFNTIRENLYECGIAVFQMTDVPVDELRGFAVHDDQYPAIIVNRNDSYAGRIFTLVHELVHLVTGCGNALTESPDISIDHSSGNVERNIDNLVGEILAPQRAVLAEKLLEFDVEVMCDSISKKFLVSPISIALVFLKNKQISQTQFIQVKKAFVEKAKIETMKKRKKGGFLPPTTDAVSINGKMYARGITRAYYDGKITISSALSALDVGFNTFKKMESMI